MITRTSWKEVRWGDLAALKYGKALRGYKGATARYPVYGTNGPIGWHDTPLCPKPGIIIGRKGAYRGVYLSDKPFFVIDTAFYLDIQSEEVDLGWAYYQLRDYDINNIDSGSAIPSTSREAFYQIPVNLPPLATQRKIAFVLSAYDNLIENNTRRIELLEEMAQAIYREWFVNFRFPGHEKVAMVDSELGPIPEGWRVGKIGDYFATVLGGTPSRKKPEFWEHGSVPWINSGKANEIRVISESEEITELGLRRSSAKLMPKRTTIIAITGATLGQVSLLEIEACANQSIVGVYDEQRLFSEYLYLTFTEIIDSVVQHASGGAQQHINKEIVRDVKVALPTVPIIEAFNSLVRPMFDSIANLLIRNDNLRRTRDLLLPKLISGEVDVTHLNIDLEATQRSGV